MPGTSSAKRPRTPTFMVGHLRNPRWVQPARTTRNDTGLDYIDHRPLVTIAANDLPASVRAVWDLTPDIKTYIEAVHRLSDLGAVVTHAAHGISHEGFDVEWRLIDIFTFEGDLVSRCEMFDEADLDAALADFDELHAQARRSRKRGKPRVRPLL